MLRQIMAIEKQVLPTIWQHWVGNAKMNFHLITLPPTAEIWITLNSELFIYFFLCSFSGIMHPFLFLKEKSCCLPKNSTNDNDNHNNNESAIPLSFTN